MKKYNNPKKDRGYIARGKFYDAITKYLINAIQTSPNFYFFKGRGNEEVMLGRILIRFDEPLSVYALQGSIEEHLCDIHDERNSVAIYKAADARRQQVYEQNLNYHNEGYKTTPTNVGVRLKPTFSIIDQLNTTRDKAKEDALCEKLYKASTDILSGIIREQSVLKR